MNRKNKISNLIKATLRNLIVAFIYCLILFLIIYMSFSKEIKQINTYINLITLKSSKHILKDVKLDLKNRKLESYPTYGSIYATIKIDSINVELPVYFGDDYQLLMNGIGHDSGSYFPGEGGSIIYLGHNTIDMLRDLPNVSNGDIIEIETIYGTFKYVMYDSKIFIETEMYKELPVNKDKEILMIYTCYPVTALGHTDKRYVIYARLLEE